MNIKNNIIKSQLSKDGIALIRNEETTYEQFISLIENNSSHICIDPARKGMAPGLVSSGTEEIGLHLENGTFCNVPHLCWFFCEKAPEKGSRTTFCDGVKIWSHLSKKTKKIFISKKIKFERIFSIGQWRNILSNYDPSFCMEKSTQDDIIRFGNKFEGQIFKKHTHGSVISEFTTSAVLKSNFSQNFSFANSLFTPSYNYAPPVITFENGEVIDPSILKEIEHLTKKFTVSHDWKDGDILVLDNHRIMHGREKIISKNRKIYNIMSFI